MEGKMDVLLRNGVYENDVTMCVPRMLQKAERRGASGVRGDQHREVWRRLRRKGR